MKFEKKVALKALRSMHADHVNFSKTLLKNMNSYLHSTTKAEDHFKKVVEILPLQTERMTMESLEIYLAILNKIANDVILHSHKKGNSVKKRRRVTIIKIVLTCLLECASNFPILREYIFNTVVNYCKKAIETKLEVATVMTDFIGIYLCKFATSLEEKCFKTSLELFYTFTQEEKKLLRILYTIHANFPSFFENTRTSAFMKEKIRPIKYENFDPAFMFNSELYRIDIFVEDLEAICKNFSSMKAEQVKIKNYFIFVNLFCFKKKVVTTYQVSATISLNRRKACSITSSFLQQASQGRIFRTTSNFRHSSNFFCFSYFHFRQEDTLTLVCIQRRFLP
jgi:hypothetical protein